MNRSIVILPVIMVLMTAACGNEAIGPVPAGMRPGVLEHYGDTVLLTAPTTARVNEPVTLSVRTYGNGCLAKGETQLTIRDQTLTLRPFDLIPEPGFCTDILLTVEHSVAIQLATQGLWELRVHGLKEPGSKPLTVRRDIVVQCERPGRSLTK